MPRARKTAKGRLNKLIDDFVHPHFKDYPALTLLDGLLHMFVEQDLEVSLRKFIKYGVPELMQSVKKRCKRSSSKV